MTRKVFIPSLIYNKPLEKVKNSYEKVMSSGHALYEINCGAKISGHNFSNMFLKMQIYPNGVVLKPFFCIPFGLTSNQICAIEQGKTTIYNIIKINHKSQLIHNPLEIRLKYTQQTYEELQKLLQY